MNKKDKQGKQGKQGKKGKKDKKGKQASRSASMELVKHHGQILEISMDRVIVLIMSRLWAFASYSEFMTRMSIVISGQQSVLSSPGLSQSHHAVLHQVKGAWDLASLLSRQAADSLAVLHDRTKEFVRLYREAESDLGDEKVSSILNRINENAKMESEWYRQLWGEFLQQIRLAGLPHRFMIGNLGSERVAPLSSSVSPESSDEFRAHFDEIKRSWVVDGPEGSCFAAR